jgi:DNA-binding transcriptional LysR family regulator
MQDIRISDLILFDTLARVKAIRLAARELGIEASIVSRRLRMLESEFGYPLFQRSSGGISLTPDGQHALVSVGRILKESRSLTHKKSTGSHSSGRTYGIASTNYLIENLLPQCLPDLELATKNSRFRLIELFPDQLLSPGIKGLFDIAVHTGELDWPSSWITEQVGSMRWSFVVRRSHPLLIQKASEKNSRIFPQSEIVKYPFILPFDFNLESGFHFRNDRCSIPFEHRIAGHEVQRADVAIQIVRNTNQICFLPVLVAEPWVRTGELVVIEVESGSAVELPVFISVQSALVSKSLYLRLEKSVRNALALSKIK